MPYNLRDTEARQARDNYAGSVRRLFQEGNGQDAVEPSQQTQGGALCTVCAEELHGDALHRLPCHPDSCIRCLLRTYTHQNGHRCPQCRAQFAFEVLEGAGGDEGTLPLRADIIEHVDRNAPRADAADEYDAGEAVEGGWRPEEDVLMLPGTNTLLLELPQLNRNLELGIEEPPLPGSMAEMEEAMANNPELYGPARQEEQDEEWRPSTEPSQQPSENTEQAGGRAWVDVVNTGREAATPAASGSSNGAAEAAQPRRQNNNTRPRTSSTGSRANMSLATRRQGRQHGRRQRQIYLPRGFQLPRSVARRPQRTRGGQPAMRSPNPFQALETIDEEEAATDETATQQPQQRSGREWRPTSQQAARPEAVAPTQRSAAHPDTPPRTSRSVWRPVSQQHAPQPASSSVQEGEAPEGECEYMEGDYQYGEGQEDQDERIAGGGWAGVPG